MPVIARFYGMIIKMYFLGSEHNPPHFHVIYGDYTGVISIQTLEIMDGDLPAKAVSLVREWASLHQTELLRIWETQQFEALPPLE